jgi:hypothetical protein
MSSTTKQHSSHRSCICSCHVAASRTRLCSTILHEGRKGPEGEWLGLGMTTPVGAPWGPEPSVMFWCRPQDCMEPAVVQPGLFALLHHHLDLPSQLSPIVQMTEFNHRLWTALHAAEVPNYSWPSAPERRQQNEACALESPVWCR